MGRFYLFSCRLITKLSRCRRNDRSDWKAFPTFVEQMFNSPHAGGWLCYPCSTCFTQRHPLTITLSKRHQIQNKWKVLKFILGSVFVFVFFFEKSNLYIKKKTASVWASVTAADDKNRLDFVDLVKISESQCRRSKVNYCMHTCTRLPLPNLLWHLFSAGKRPVEDEAY